LLWISRSDIVWDMPKRLPTDSTPDLFATTDTDSRSEPERKVSPRSASTLASSEPPRYLLPRDLPNALRWLDDKEIDALFAAVSKEIRRRGRIPAGTPPAVAGRASVQNNRTPVVNRRNKPSPEPELTVGKANAVRAAFTAGVKPATIAREFGISQAAVRQALAAARRQRKS